MKQSNLYNELREVEQTKVMTWIGLALLASVIGYFGAHLIAYLTK